MHSKTRTILVFEGEKANIPVYFNIFINVIDQMVYKLYELSYEEVKIVDPDFLMSKEEYENK